MATSRTAAAHWEGSLMEGAGTVELTSTHLAKFDVTWAARTEAPADKTSPEELIAAAHASCFSMALSHALATAGTPATSLDTTATASFDKTDAGWRVVSMALDVVGTVPGLDDAAFAAAADGAKDGCPVSVALAGNVELSVTARLG